MLTRPVTGPSFDQHAPLKLVPTGASTKPPVDGNNSGDHSASRLAAADTGDPWRGDAMEAATGNRAAFERLYRAHTARVYSICMRMVSDRTQAEELTQDVFVRVWQKLPTFRGDSAVSTWLHRVAVNVVLTQQKSDNAQARVRAYDDKGGQYDRRNRDHL